MILLFRICLFCPSALLWCPSSRQSACQCWRCRLVPWVWKSPRRREWQPTPAFLPGEFLGQRSLAGYSPWGCKKLDMTERLHLLTNFCYLFFFIIVYFLATSWGMWDLSSSSRDQTCALCIGNTGVLTTGKPILLKKNSKNQLLSHVQLFATPWTVAR